MLTAWRQEIACHLQAATTSFEALSIRPWMTMSTVLIIAIVLALPALSWIFSDNLSAIAKGWEQEGRISLYLKTALSPQESQTLLTQIRATQGVQDATLKTPEEGLASLKNQEGMTEVLSYLPENPLPPVIEVLPIPSFNHAIQASQLLAQFKGLNGVQDVSANMVWLEKFDVIRRILTRVGYTLMIFLAFAVMCIIGNTLQTVVNGRREEIQVLKLLGATDAFILRPFLYIGIWYGVIGAIFGLLFVNIFMLSIALCVDKLSALYHIPFELMGLSLKQAYSMLALSVLLGWLGAWLSVKYQMADIEP